MFYNSLHGYNHSLYSLVGHNYRGLTYCGNECLKQVVVGCLILYTQRDDLQVELCEQDSGLVVGIATLLTPVEK